MTEAHNTRYSLHPDSTKMCHNLKNRFWWNNMKREIAAFVSRCLTCQLIKAEHQKPLGLLQPFEIPEWKWEHVTMDFVSGLPTTKKGNNAIWVIIDRLTKSMAMRVLKMQTESTRGRWRYSWARFMVRSGRWWAVRWLAVSVCTKVRLIRCCFRLPDIGCDCDVVMYMVGNVAGSIGWDGFGKLCTLDPCNVVLLVCTKGGSVGNKNLAWKQPMRKEFVQLEFELLSEDESSLLEKRDGDWVASDDAKGLCFAVCGKLA